MVHEQAKRFHTINEMASPGNSCAYFGDSGDWWVVYSVHRDSHSLSRSNFRVMLKRLQDKYPDGVKVERFSHCLVGWMDHMIVRGVAPLLMAARMDKAIAAYPCLDESDWSELESEDFWSWAKSELEHLDGWEQALSDVLNDSDGPNSCGGAESDDSIGWDCIEAAKNKLEGTKDDEEE